MPRKRKSPFSRSTSFQKGGENPNRFSGHASTDLAEARVWSRLSLPQATCSETSLSTGPVPVTPSLLRPRSSSVPASGPQEAPHAEDSQNWIVDEGKLLECFNGAMQEHADYNKRVKGRNKGHTPVLEKLMDRRLGFGVVVRYRCKYQNCRFESSAFDLFQRTESGSAQLNLQAGTAMAKSDLTPTKVDFLATVMNIKPPGHRTLQRNYNLACEAAEPLAENAMADNRRKVYESMERKGEWNPKSGGRPKIRGATDGQYQLRSYHIPSGKSESASIPVIELETGEGGLIGHSSLSKREGTLKSHIKLAERQGSKENFVNLHQATRFPVTLKTVGADADATIEKGFQEGVEECGECERVEIQNCSQHGMNAAKRKFMREALRPLTNAQKQKLCPKPFERADDATESFTTNICPKCKGTFKNARGVAAHERHCKGSAAISGGGGGGGVGLEPLFFRWHLSGNAVGADEKKIIRNRIRIWLFSRMKKEFYTGLADQNPDKEKVADDSEIKAKLLAAGKTIPKCIAGDHSSCESDSFVCSGASEPTSYASLPLGKPLRDVPSVVAQWIYSVVDLLLGSDSLNSLVVNGLYATTSLVESAHFEIRKTIPKGFPHKRNETKLIKSGGNLACSFVPQNPFGPSASHFVK